MAEGNGKRERGHEQREEGTTERCGTWSKSSRAQEGRRARGRGDDGAREEGQRDEGGVESAGRERGGRKSIRRGGQWGARARVLVYTIGHMGEKQRKRRERERCVRTESEKQRKKGRNKGGEGNGGFGEERRVNKHWLRAITLS